MARLAKLSPPAASGGKATAGTRTPNLRFTKQPGGSVTNEYVDSYNAAADGAGNTAGSCDEASVTTPARAVNDADLAAVVAAWPALPDAIRRAAMALVSAGGGQ